MYNGGNLTQATVNAKAVTVLTQLRTALEGVQDFYGWTSGIAATDLETLGFSATDAATLLSAIADADALAQIYATGQPPSTYPQAASAYVYAASQRQVIGPQ